MNNNQEIWKEITIDGFTREVSNFGRVKKVAKSKLPYTPTNKSDYTMIGFPKKMHLTHRVIATAFIPTNDTSLYINHIDGNKQNNNVDNLEWCTQSENMQHAWKTGLMENARLATIQAHKDGKHKNKRLAKKIK